MENEQNEDYELEYGAANIITKNKNELTDLDENLQNWNATYKVYKRNYGLFNKKIKKITQLILRGQEKCELMKQEKTIIVKEIFDLLLTTPKSEEHDKAAIEKRNEYKKLASTYNELHEKLIEQEEIVSNCRNQVLALGDVVIDRTNIINELNIKVAFCESEINRRKRDIIESHNLLNMKGNLLRSGDISKEKAKALKFQMNLLNIEIKMNTERMEELRAMNMQAKSKLDGREFDLNNKKNEFMSIETERYLEVKKEMEITDEMEEVMKKMEKIKQEIIDMRLINNEIVTKLESLQKKFDRLMKKWSVLNYKMDQQQKYVEFLSIFWKKVIEEKHKMEVNILVLTKKSDTLSEMVNQMSKLKLKN